MSVMIHCVMDGSTAGVQWRGGDTHPKRLLAHEIGMADVRPETSRDEPPPRILGRPRQPRARPVHLCIILLYALLGLTDVKLGKAGAFIGLKGELLVVCCKLQGEGDECESGEDHVRGGERLVGLEDGGDVGGHAEEEKENVLGCG